MKPPSPEHWNPFVARTPEPHHAPPHIPDHELLRRIGSGSYGEVWLARSITGSFRAVKIVYRDSFDDERPFQREFEGIQCFEPLSRNHDSQVDILHVGQSDGCFYYVMELADDAQAGTAIVPEQYIPHTLRSDLVRRGPVPVEECLRIGLALTTALDHLHRHKLVHRDIKPSNIIFINGIPKLADIGLVASTAEKHSFVGTHGFFPPEGPGTPSADLYSLGKVLYEMCTGLDRQEFPDLPTQLIKQTSRDGLLELNAIIAKACRSKPDERYQSAREMHAELSLMQSGKSVRRARSIERRLAILTRVGIATAVVGSIMAAAFLFQRNQTNIARRLAEENLKLAEESRRFAEESRRNLIRLQTANGTRLLSEKDPFGAALWFAENLKLAGGDGREVALHRLRLDWILRDAPKIERVFVHTGAVNVAHFSPDNTRVLTASDDRTARLWDANTGVPLCAPLTHRFRVMTAEFSADASKFATGTGNSACVWNGTNGAPIASLEHTGWVATVKFNPTGNRLLTASSSGTARIWDATSGEPITPFLRHPKAISCAEWSPDGTRILTGSQDNTAKLWDGSTGKLLRTIQLSHDVDRVEFRRGGSQVLIGTGRAGGSKSVQFSVWNLETGERVMTSPRFAGNGVGFVKPSPDERLVIIGGSPLIGWSTVRNAVAYESAQGALRAIAFSPNGELAATGSERNGLAHVWKLNDGESVVAPLKHGGYVNHVQFNSDGTKLLTASDDGAARIWSLKLNQGPALTLHHGREVWHAEFSPDGKRILTAETAGTARVWDAANGELLLPPLVNSNRIALAKFSGNGKRILLAPGAVGKLSVSDRVLSVWDADTGALVGRLRENTNITAAAIDREGRWIASCTSAGQVRLWHADSGKRGPMRFNYRHAATHLEFSADGKRLLMASSGGSASVRDWSNGNFVVTNLWHDSSVQYATFSHDERRIATVSADQTGRIWDVDEGKPLTPSFKHRGNLLRIGFSADGRLVASTGLSMRARVWDATTGEQAAPEFQHEKAVNHAVFHPTEPILLTCSDDRTARLWDLTSGEPLTPPIEHEGDVVHGQFAPHGKSFLTVCTKGSVRVWRMPQSSSSNEQLIQQTHLLASHRYNHSGALVPLTPEMLRTYSKAASIGFEASGRQTFPPVR